MVDGSNSLIIWLYRHQSATDPRRQAGVEKEIEATISSIRSVNQYYLKNEISDEEDRQMTEASFRTLKRIESTLPAFLAGSRAQNDAVALGALQGSDGVGAAARQLIAGYQKQLRLNVGLANELRKQNDRTYQSTVWSMVGGSVTVILILAFFALRTIFAIRR